MSFDEFKIFPTIVVNSTEVNVNIDTKMKADIGLGQVLLAQEEQNCCVVINRDEEEILSVIVVVVVGNGVIEYDDDAGDDDNDDGEYVVVDIVWRKLYFNGNMMCEWDYKERNTFSTIVETIYLPSNKQTNHCKPG